MLSIEANISGSQLVTPSPEKSGEDVSIETRTGSIYNDAKLIFHAIGPKYNIPELAGFDPPRALELMDLMLEEFVNQDSDLTIEDKSRISNIQKSLSKARTNYLTCIQFVFNTDGIREREAALQLAQDVKNLSTNPSGSSILFMGGHYIKSKEGNLGGHTAAYDVALQSDGKWSFIINNTGTGVKKYHETTANRTSQLIYTDLTVGDLNEDFWRGLIQTNFINPVSSSLLMDSFYTYVDAKLGKAGNNKIAGRSLKHQKNGVGVCAWKSLSTWVHGAISPGKFKEDRDLVKELVFVRYKKFMFEKMRTNFKPTYHFKAVAEKISGMIFTTVQFSIYHFNKVFGNFLRIKETYFVYGKEQATSVFLRSELDRKIQKMDEKINAIKQERK